MTLCRIDINFSFWIVQLLDSTYIFLLHHVRTSTYFLLHSMLHIWFSLCRILLRFISFNFNFIYFTEILWFFFQLVNFFLLLRFFVFHLLSMIEFNWTTCKLPLYWVPFYSYLCWFGKVSHQRNVTKSEIPFIEGFGQQCVVTKCWNGCQTNANKQNECVIKFVDRL